MPIKRQFNVLLSSAGRRVALLELFRHALTNTVETGRIIVADCSMTAPTFHLADMAYQVPRCNEKQFIHRMLDISLKEKIALIIPTIDTELPIYSASRDEFAEIGAQVAISGPQSVAICADKVQTNSWLKECGFSAVKQWHGSGTRLAEEDFPVIVKPRRGSASIGLNLAMNQEELNFYARRISEPVVEEIATGDEYTINILIGRNGRVLSAVPHRRLEVRSGEVSKGVTKKNVGLMETARRLGEALPDAFGALNIQGFLDANGIFRIFEINARFGGGYPLAHRAGVHFPKWLIEEVLGLPSTARFDDWEDGLAMLRYDDAVFIRREALGDLS